MLLRLPREILRKILIFVIVTRQGNDIQYTCRELYDEYKLLRCRFEPLVTAKIPENRKVIDNLRYMILVKYGRFKVPNFKHFQRLTILEVGLSHHSHWGVLKSLPESLDNLTLLLNKRFRYAPVISDIIPLPVINIRYLKIISKYLVRVKAFRFYQLVQQRDFLVINTNTHGSERSCGMLIGWLLRTYRKSLILFQVLNIDLDLVFNTDVTIELPRLKLIMFDNTSLVRLEHWLEVFNKANVRTRHPLFILMIDLITRTVYTSTSNNTGNWSSVPYTNKEVSRVLDYLEVY